MIKAVLDRFEGGKAVLLFGDAEEKVVFPRKYFPTAQEGDYFTVEISYDEPQTVAARQEAEILLKKISE